MQDCKWMPEILLPHLNFWSMVEMMKMQGIVKYAVKNLLIIEDYDNILERFIENLRKSLDVIGVGKNLRPSIH